MNEKNVYGSNIQLLVTSVMEMMLTGTHPIFETLRLQYEKSLIASVEFTGCGFFVQFKVHSDVISISQITDFEISDVHSEIAGLQDGVGFILFVRDGKIDMLECYTYDELLPEILDDFTLYFENTEERLLPHQFQKLP